MQSPQEQQQENLIMDELTANTEWIDADYWHVYNESDEDTIIFRGSMTACKKYAKNNNNLIVAHVILERQAL